MPKTFALVPAHPDVELGAFAEELARHLPGAALVIDAARFDAANGKDASRDRRGRERSPALGRAGWRAEHDNDFVLLVADAHPETWTLRCLRQADQVLLVGRTGDDAIARSRRAKVAGGPPPTRRGVDRLVLLHAAETERPTGTARWLDQRSRIPHHHVRRGDAEHHARLARHLTGRAVGLALGGGGARGFAHAGVLVALRELGIPVDCFGGTSMGAGLAAAGAMQLDKARIVAYLRKALLVDTASCKPGRFLLSISTRAASTRRSLRSVSSATSRICGCCTSPCPRTSPPCRWRSTSAGRCGRPRGPAH